MSPEETKNLKIGAGVVVGLGLLYFLVVKKNDNSGGTQDPTGNGGYIPSIPVFSAQKTATALYETMKDMGTEEEAILEILKYINQTQFGQVVNAFGMLNYNPVTGDQRNYNPFASLTKYGLKFWLNNELSPQEYSILRTKYPYYL
jgi:hypothetical protein